MCIYKYIWLHLITYVCIQDRFFNEFNGKATPSQCGLGQIHRVQSARAWHCFAQCLEGPDLRSGNRCHRQVGARAAWRTTTPEAKSWQKHVKICHKHVKHIGMSHQKEVKTGIGCAPVLRFHYSRFTVSISFPEWIKIVAALLLPGARGIIRGALQSMMISERSGKHFTLLGEVPQQIRRLENHKQLIQKSALFQYRNTEFWQYLNDS